MTVAILIQGRLERAPESRMSRNGSPYSLATIRVQSGSELQFWRVFAFCETAREELSRLDAGDALACQGAPKFEIYRPEGGEARLSLSITADHVLPLRQPPRQRARKGESEGKEPRRYMLDGLPPQERSGGRPAGRGGALHYDVRKSPYAPSPYAGGEELNDEIPF